MNQGKTVSAIAIMIACMGLFLRTYHLGYGLPDLAHVDSFKFVGEASRMASSGKFEPSLYQYPGLYTNMLAAAYYLGSVQSTYVQHLIASGISAVAGSLLILPVFAIASRCSTGHGPLVASCLTAFCIASITLSRIAAPDTLMSLLMSAALAALIRKNATGKHFAFAGFCAGLAAGSKFTGLYILPWLPVAAWIAAGPKKIKEMISLSLLAYSAFTAAFLATSPWFLPRLSLYLQRMSAEAQLQSSGQLGAVQEGYFDYLFSATPTWDHPWLSTSFLGNWGGPLTLIAVIALLWAIFGSRDPLLIFFGAFILVYFFLIVGPGRIKAFRFMLPILPLLSVVVACFIERVLMKRVVTFRPFVITALLLVLLYPQIAKAKEYLAATAYPTTNELAQKWISENIPSGTKVFRSPLYLSHMAKLPLKFVLLNNAGGRLYRTMDNNPERHPLFLADMIDAYRSSGIHYVISNSYFENLFSPVPENIRFFPSSVRNYGEYQERLRTEATLVYLIRGWSEHRLGPDISVHRLTEEARKVTP